MTKLLFTGASGFLGDNLAPLLQTKYEMHTLGLLDTDHFKINLAESIPDFFGHEFDVILHAAGKAHKVPKSRAEKMLFFDINHQGTVNLCKGLERNKLPKSFIFVSSVAVYGRDYGENIDENHPLDGEDAYARSKIEAEMYLTKWCKDHNVTLSIIRPSLIAGPNPPGNLGTMIKGIRSNRYFSIARGTARKSVLMVQDIANLLPSLIEKGGIYNVCDDEHPTFSQLEKIIAQQLGKNPPASIPYWVAKIMALAGDCLGRKAPINSYKLKKITESLTFSNEKAKKELGWKPMNVLENFKIEG